MSFRTHKEADIAKKTERGPKGQSVCWCDTECKVIITNRKNKLNKFKQTGHQEDFIEFQKSKTIVRKTIRRKKRDNFNNSLMELIHLQV